ncbi:MAG: Gfo/Idh/MocA family oxidoreductase [Bacteroidales bacterium]|jgi:predicted dehydrogenase|nr:Gfo/Idh/MocA family oxidoreductase [Bacteroidales bacterium]
MLSIAVIGAGHLGKIHLKCLQGLPERYNVVGFFDIDAETSARVEAELGVKSFSNSEELIQAVDVVNIVTPTISHFDIASLALRKGKHVFIEKPITTTPQEAQKILALANEAGVKTQVGHVERFNPAFLAVKDKISNPVFIEIHRLAMFNPRGLDVPVILDLMIHDIDLVLSVVDSPVRKISASGGAIVSETPDIANVRMEFNNGCVANLTASRISMENMRKMRFFQKDAYISVDFLEKKAEIIRMNDVTSTTHNDPFAMIIDLGNGKQKHIQVEKPEIKPINAIQTELSSFHDAIINDTATTVPFIDGYNALEVAYQIMNEIQSATR